MAEIAEELLTIDLGLRFALFGLECALDVSFDGAECERVFLDAANNQVSSKHYRFFSSSRLTVNGQVDDYEPESIRLRVEGQRGCGEILRRITQNSTFAVYRMRKAMDEMAQRNPSIPPPE